MNSLTYYRQIADKHPALPLEQEAALMQAVAEAPTREAREAAAHKLVLHNVGPVVRMIARRGFSSPQMLEDAIGAGMQGLNMAARRAQNHGKPFIAFAVVYVRRHVIELLRAAPAVTMSRHGYVAAKATSSRHAGKRGTDARSAARAALSGTVSLDAPITCDQSGEGSVTSYSSITVNLPDQSESPAASAETKDLLDVALATLEGRHLEIIKLRYGLDGEDPLSLPQVGERLGISGERVRQIETQAFTLLRRQVVEAIS